MFFALPMLNSEQDMVELLKIKNGMDEIDRSNRHEVQIPLHIRATHPALNFLHFFQKWIKPILAEFVATFILVFWACMLQPTVRKNTRFSHPKTSLAWLRATHFIPISTRILSGSCACYYYHNVLGYLCHSIQSR